MASKSLSPSPRHDQMRVVIVGAGVAGLATAYALRQDASIQVRILERQQEHDMADDESYPVHLSKTAREALHALLSKNDLERLDRAQRMLPMLHDGVTAASPRGVAWRMVRNPGQRCMIDRKALLDILRGGTNIEYGKGVGKVIQNEINVVVQCEDGEMMEADVLIGADGMFSTVRRFALPRPAIGITRLPWVTIKFRSSSSKLCAFIPDKHGMNLLYGKGWSAACDYTFTSRSSNSCHIALTIADSMLDIRSAIARYAGTPFIDILLQEADFACDSTRTIRLYTNTQTVVGSGRIVLIGDAAHGMAHFCIGASSGIEDGLEVARALRLWSRTCTLDVDGALTRFNKDMRRRNNQLIRQSNTLLWLAQRERAPERLLRRMVFGILEMREIFGDRRILEAKLHEVIHTEAVDAKEASGVRGSEKAESGQ